MNEKLSSDAVRSTAVCSSNSLLSISEKADSPLNLRLAATGVSGSTGPFLPWTSPNPLSFDKSRWSPCPTGWSLEPICTKRLVRGMSDLVTSQLSVSRRWMVLPSRPLAPSTPPLMTSTTAEGTSFRMVPISRNRSTMLIRTLSITFEMKSRLSSLSNSLSLLLPPNSKEPYRTNAVGRSLALMCIFLWSSVAPCLVNQE